MDTKIEGLISKMERSRARLNAVLEKVAPQTEIYPTWKLKQVYDHIAGWDDLVITTLNDYLRGESPALVVKNGINQFNAESVTVRQALPLEESQKAYEVARGHVLQILRQVPPEKLNQKFPAPWGGMCTVDGIVKTFVSHEQEHTRQIEEVLKNSAAGN